MVGRYLGVHINSDWKLPVSLYVVVVVVSSTPLFPHRLQRPGDEHAGPLAHAYVGGGCGGMVMRRHRPGGVVASM